MKNSIKVDETTQQKLRRLELQRAKALIAFWERWYRQNWQSVGYSGLEGAYPRLKSLYYITGRDPALLRRRYLLHRAERLARAHVSGEKKEWGNHTDTLRHISKFLAREGIDPQAVGGAVRRLRQKVIRQRQARKYRGPRRKAWWVYTGPYRGFKRILAAPRENAPHDYFTTRKAAKAAYLTDTKMTGEALGRGRRSLPFSFDFFCPIT